MDRDGGGLGKEDQRTATTCGAMFLGMLGALGYAAYRVIMWLSTQTS